MNVSKFEEQISRKWLQAALAGDFASAWSASDEIQRARLCFSGRAAVTLEWFADRRSQRPCTVLARFGRCHSFHSLRAPCPGKGQEPHSRGSWDAGAPLLRRVSGIDRWVELDTEDFHNKDYVQIESTELPNVFRTTLDSIPCEVPYICIEEFALGMTTKKAKVGLCWCGGSFFLSVTTRIGFEGGLLDQLLSSKICLIAQWISA